MSFQSEAKNPGFVGALIFGTTVLRSGRSVVEGAAVGAEKDPGFFAALRMTSGAAARCFLLNAGYAKLSLDNERLGGGVCLRAGLIIAISIWMAFRGSAVAVLAGWILLAPSIDCARRGLQRETPLSEWEHVDQFGSQASCESYRQTVIDTEKDDSGNIYVQRYSYAICIRDDDPRLKGE